MGVAPSSVSMIRVDPTAKFGSGSMIHVESMIHDKIRPRIYYLSGSHVKIKAPIHDASGSHN